MANYADKPSHHRHKCPKCGFVWEHSNALTNLTVPHKCPCGQRTWAFYRGPESPQFSGDGPPKRGTSAQKPKRTEEPCPD